MPPDAASTANENLIDTYRKHRAHTSLEVPKQRLLSDRYPADDPGLAGLLPGSEEDWREKLRVYFIDQIDAWEQAEAGKRT